MELDITHEPARGRLFQIVSMAISIASLLVVVVLLLGRDPVGNPVQLHPAMAVERELAALELKPGTLALTPEKSMRARTAIRRGAYPAARQIIASVLADSHLQNWRFYPFTDFMTGIADITDTAFEARLDAWVAHDPNDAIPLLVRAQYHHDLGWFRRGNRFAGNTPADHMTAFVSDMRKAQADINAAIALNEENPYAFYLRLLILRGFGLSPDLSTGFEQGVAKYPGYYPLYDVFLSVLEPRWGGTVPAMYEFVERYAGHAGDQSPLNLLYLNLYRRLLGAASLACDNSNRSNEQMNQCVVSIMGKLVTPALEHRIPTALRLYDHTDRHQFDVEIGDVLTMMLAIRGGDVHSGAILQLAAEAMHSDTQLKQDKPSVNDYVIDQAVALSWNDKKFYDNALKKSREALVDIKRATFPDAEERALAVAKVYNLIAHIYSGLDQYVPMIAYEKAYMSLSGRSVNGHYICYGYYRLKDYDDGLRECSKSVDDGTGGPRARYWRGLMYKGLGQTDAALRDFTAVADSEDYNRGYAAIEISMAFFGRDDNRGALDVLNKYTYLYNANTENRSNVAVAFNNRCYAYMQLGELKKALDDCTESLKYDSLPDAYRKQQQLIERLASQKAAL